MSRRSWIWGLRGRTGLSVVLLLAAAMLVVTACGGGAGQDAGGDTGTGSDSGSGGGAAAPGPVTLNVGLDVDADSGDPRLARTTSGWRLRELVFDGLVELDEDLKPQPALATEWETPDPTTYVFHLRQGVKFHDGSDFTAEDVVHTFTTMLDPDFQAPYRALYTPIERVEALDDYTVQFTLSQPYAPLMSYMDLGIVPAEAAEGFADKPVGTGPYRLVNWEKNSKLTLAANTDWWGGEPKIDEIVLHVIPDNTSRALALEAGDVQLIHSPLSPQDIPNLEAAADLTVHKLTALGYTYINMNTADPILSDVRVRRAIAHLVPQDDIVENIYLNMDYPGRSPLIPAWAAYDESIRQPGYDPDAAAALLAEAGWTDSDGDGILDKDGQKLSLLLKTHAEDPNRIQVLEYLQNMFTQAGIEARVETAEWPTFFNGLLQGDYQLAVVGWLNLVDPDRGMYNQFLSGGGNNYGKYANAEVDRLLELGRSSLDADERVQHYRDAARILVQEVPYYVLTYQGYIAAHHNSLTGFVPNPRGSFRSLAGADYTP